MPTYQYRCTQCGNELEVVQKFTDPALTECAVCHGALRKVYNAVGVVFKGSGFYRTDSRAADGKKSGSGGSGESTKKDKVEAGASTGGSSVSKESGGAKESSGSSSSGSEKSSSGSGSGSGSDKKPSSSSSTAA